ncbi:uncharacterized protein MYCFIDRAFT_187499 [Pseudocercospora fijiensis CIRAD86]|uniref:Calpain catalytic domain-containing protein n=1 Tax=Pseudocercospora fijiensis (strain CIRAD86) TaxID=383855 RepID=M2Z3X7_PSEFD|nr:uncharacterized protein MYCFIDRAFT_187499 [Pseudocercospora fijiensis CIRAD86]EME84520.1 hypothetical protein MYCFIDRAFT_187499 [Pseudocercospora fijiensis CIRAD86]
MSSKIDTTTTIDQDSDTCSGSTTHAASSESYAAARRSCIEDVQAIAKNCMRNNERFTDPDFDLKNDFWNPKGSRNCLNGLFASVSRDDQRELAQWGDDNQFPVSDIVDGVHTVDCRRLPEKNIRIRAGTWTMDLKQDPDKQDNEPKSVHRISETFGSPIIATGCPEPLYTSTQMAQGQLGDCWFLSAVAALGNRNDLLQKVCVAWDLKLGIYGFCFYQHGAWTHVIVDDFLYLTAQDFHTANDKNDNLNCERCDSYRAENQSGSNALHFAKCQNASQIWLPLLEKAFAKLHGDFYALRGGMPDEGIEDLTGGVASRFDTLSISDHDRLWTHTVRLLRIRNPWGSSRRGLWHGPWARGSKEWTPFASLWLKRSADDGVFYMTFEDALKTFQTLHIARIFNETWSSCQAWTELSVSWIPQYNNVYFQLEVTCDTETVLSLQQNT